MQKMSSHEGIPGARFWRLQYDTSKMGMGSRAMCWTRLKRCCYACRRNRRMISKRILLKAIRKNCLDCSGGVASEVLDCSMNMCPLYPYRMGLAGLYKEKGEKE